MKKLLSIIACLVMSMTMLMAQTKTVSGRVISGEDGEPIIGASVVVTGTSTGTITDIDGNFSLRIPESAKTLTVSFVGMESKTVNITNKSMEIVLSANNEVLDEVMVVAFGTAKKSAFTGSAKVVGEETLALSQVTDVTSALAGAVAGVTLTSSNGGPGSSPTIRVRGFSSLNAGNDPLIIVDGAPYSGDMNNINPADIESMTVLKDAASNALYGARGANGVIMITTKRAKQGHDAVVSVDTKWGTNTRALKQYNVLKDPRQYYELQYAAMNNYYQDRLGLSAGEAWQRANQNITTSNGGFGYNIWTVPENEVLIGTNGKMNPNASLGRLVNYRGVDYWVTPDDWMDVGTRTGNRQEYNVSISGASDKGTFLMSVGYLDNEGITENSSYDRLTARLRADYQAKKWLNVGGSFNYTKYEYNSLGDNGNSSSSGNIWAFTSQMAPIYPAYLRDANGNIMIDDNGNQVMDYGNGMNAGFGRPFISDANPIQDVRLNTNQSEGNALGAYGFADATIYKGLVLSLKASANLDEYRGTHVYNPYYGQFDSTGGTVSKSHGRAFNYNMQQLLNYTTTFNDKHNLNVMIGHEYYRSEGYSLSASKSKMFSQKNKELNGAVVDGQSSGSSKSIYNNEGFFGRVQYDFEEKYFASASFRRDASSRFHPDNRWGTFWSIGGAWIASKESFMEGTASWLDNLKVKASYGSQGNDNIGNYRYTDLYDIVNASGNIGTSFSAKGTHDITWETQGNFNAGVEFGLWKRVSGSLEYYYRKTTDMLFSFSVAPSLGYSSYYDNVGDMYNTGVELDMSINAYHSKNINWDINFNISTIKNRISMLHEDKKTTPMWDANGNKYKGYSSGSFFIAEGQSIYSWWTKEFAGVDPETGKSLWYKNTYEKNGSDFAYDAEGDKIWTGREKVDSWADADYIVTGKTTLPKVQGGFGTSVRAYGFDFAVNFTYQLGGKGYDSTYAQFMANPSSSNTGYNWHADVLKAWTPENPSATVPRWQMDDQNVVSSSTRFLTNASYLNVQNINFGYTLPARLTKKAQINNVRLYLSCENVGYISKRQGFDPRQTFGGSSNATNYSPMRTISGGLSLQF